MTPGTGAVSSNALTTNYYYDGDGNQVAESDPGGLWTKDVYNGAGEVVMEYTTDGAGGTTWADADSVANDDVLEQTQYVYDNDGNVIEQIQSERFNDATGTGPLGTPTSGVEARVYYSAAYYDAANDLVATVNVGTNGGAAWTRPSTVPSASATVLVTSYVYNAAGWVQDTIDPDGIDTRNYYNALGEVTETIQNYTGNAETASSDVATVYTYDGDGNVIAVTAEEPGGAYQETAYIYGVTTAQGSAIDSNDLLYAVEQPDPTTGAPSSSNETTSTYNALGQVISYTDQNGTTHQYTYDVLGRLTADAVTTLGAGVNGSVLRIEYAYDPQGNQYLITTYDAASGGNIVNQVERLYNGLGQLTAEYQSVSGAVTIGSTPVVQYLYTELSDGNNSRLTNIVYPDGYTVDYNYGTTGGLNDTISRLDSISDDTGTLQSYQYLGLDTVVQMDDPQAGVELTYLSQTGSTGDAGDQYTGLDRFGRVVDQNWYDTNTDTSVDEVVYGYDPDGNVLYEVNTGNTSVSQLYSNNGLGELTSYQQGTLNSSDTALSGTANASQSWTLDALGNWTSVTTNGTEQTNTANQDNQYTALGSATPGYDANGNLTQDENGQQYVYNAWNQLVLVEDSFGNGLAAYSYNGLGECVIQTDGSTETALYYSSAGQVLEEQVGGVTQARNVWSPVYVNALIVRDQSSQGNGDLDQRLYALQDANWNVTALVNASGSVVERYVYTPYGQVSIYDGSWNPLSSSNYNWIYLYQGGRLDPASGMYKFGARDYDPADGRWLEQDPLGLTPDANDYRFVGDTPIGDIDPTGLAGNDSCPATSQAPTLAAPFGTRPNWNTLDYATWASSNGQDPYSLPPFMTWANQYQQLPPSALLPTQLYLGAMNPLLPIAQDLDSVYANPSLAGNKGFQVQSYTDFFLTGMLFVGAPGFGSGGSGGGVARALVHLTDEAGLAGITESGQIIGRNGIFAVPRSVASNPTWLKVAKTGLTPSRTKQCVSIPASATNLFRRPIPIGPYSGWKYLGGISYAPQGVLNTTTGAFTAGGSWIGPGALIYGPDGLFYGVGGGMYWYATTTGNK